MSDESIIVESVWWCMIMRGESGDACWECIKSGVWHVAHVDCILYWWIGRLLLHRYGFLAICSLDLVSHYARLYSSLATGSSGHKVVKENHFALMKIYYSNKYFLALMCAGNEGFWLALYLLHFNIVPLAYILIYIHLFVFFFFHFLFIPFYSFSFLFLFFSFSFLCFPPLPMSLVSLIFFDDVKLYVPQSVSWSNWSTSSNSSKPWRTS